MGNNELSTHLRAQIVALYPHGDSYRTISSALNVAIAIINSKINLYQETNPFSFKKRTRRKRSTSSRTDSASIRAVVVAGGDIQISARTMRERVVEKNLNHNRQLKSQC